MQSKMIHRAAPVAPQHAGRMRIVDHHDGAMPFGQFHQRGQRPDIAVHREYPVGDQQFVAAGAVQFLEDFRRPGGVFVRED